MTIHLSTRRRSDALQTLFLRVVSEMNYEGTDWYHLDFPSPTALAVLQPTVSLFNS